MRGRKNTVLIGVAYKMKRLLLYLGLLTLLGLLAVRFWYEDGFHWTLAIVVGMVLAGWMVFVMHIGVKLAGRRKR